MEKNDISISMLKIMYTYRVTYRSNYRYNTVLPHSLADKGKFRGKWVYYGHLLISGSTGASVDVC